jgi:hypothetical protein
MAEDKPQRSRNVARAARAARSSRPGQRRNYAFPAVIVAIVLLGTALVVYGRTVRTDEDEVPTLDTLPPAATSTTLGEDDPAAEDGDETDETDEIDESGTDGTTTTVDGEGTSDGETTTTDENDASG